VLVVVTSFSRCITAPDGAVTIDAGSAGRDLVAAGRAAGAVPLRLVWDNEAGIGRGGHLADGVAGFSGTLATKIVQLKPFDPESKGIVDLANGYLETSFLPGRRAGGTLCSTRVTGAGPGWRGPGQSPTARTDCRGAAIRPPQRRSGWSKNGRVRCPVLIGRSAVLESFGRALTSAMSGRGQVVGLVGEAGIGKTRLAEELAAMAARRGIRTLSGRASREASGTPGRPLAEALLVATRDLPPPEMSELVPFLGALGQLLPHWRAHGWVGATESSLVTAEAVLRLMRELAGDGVLVMTLEDLHWVDEATWQIIEYLVDHVVEVPVVLCLTARSDELSGPRLLALLRRSDALLHSLGRLPPNEVAEMIRACTGASLQAYDAVVAAADGLPLIVEDLLFAAGIPGRFADHVTSRLAELTPGERRAVRLAALLGERPEAEVLARLTGGEFDPARSLGLLTESGGELAFRHALTRAAVLDHTPSAERRNLAVAAGTALGAAAEGMLSRELRAAELLASGHRYDDALAILRTSTARSQLTGEVAATEAALRAAYELANRTGRAETAAIGTELVRASLQAGRSETALALAEEVLAMAEGHERSVEAELHLLLARGEIARGHWAPTRAHLKDAAGVGVSEPGLVAEMAVLEAECALGEDQPGQRAAVEHLANRGVALARAAGVAALEAEALEQVGRVARMRDLDAAAASLRDALKVTQEAGLNYRRLQILIELGTVEMLRDANPSRLGRARQEALRCGASGLSASAGLNLASAYAMTGQASDCIELARDVAAVADRLGQIPLVAGCEFIEGVGHAFLGDQVRAHQHLARAERLAPDDADLRAGTWGIGRGIGALVVEDRAAARRAFARAADEGPERYARILDAALGPAKLLAAMTDQTSPTQVRALLAAQVRGARWHDLWLGAALAVSLARDGRIEDAAGELNSALAAGSRYPLFGALVRRLVAEAIIDRGLANQIDPVTLLRDADQAFATLNLPRPASAVRSLLRQAGAAAPRRRRGDATVDDRLSRSGVTAREAEVLGLLADRLTNRQIGERLYLSTKTVEKHVAALARKLTARDRIELADMARIIRE
jgi:DNA-binding CsgD family transcriptional regulator